MNKRTEMVCATSTEVLLQPKIKRLTQYGKRIIALVLMLLILLLSSVVQARTDVTSNLIQEKNVDINEFILKASQTITLTGPRTTSTTSIPLSWTAINGITRYKIYQSKNGADYSNISSVSGTNVTLNTSNAKIKDEAIPNKPQVTATINADKTGNNLTITASQDNGTTYKHYVEAEGTGGTTGYLVFMVDYGKSNSGFVSNAKTAMKEIGRKLIAQGVQIGVVVNGGDSATASWAFTNNVATFEKNIDSMYRITHGSMAKRNASCKTNAK